MTRAEFKDSTSYIWSVGYSDEHRRIMNVCFAYIESLEQQLSNLKHNYEMQEIMIADYKKRIEELEADNKELSKDFTHSKYLDKYKEPEAPKSCEQCVHRIEPNRQFPSFSCSILQRHIRNDFYCAYYEPKDKE